MPNPPRHPNLRVLHLTIPLLTLGQPACAPCGSPEDPCRLEGREYLVVPPADPSGPLPLTVLLHGYGGTPEVLYEHEDLAEVLHARGWLQVYPEGLDNTWATRGSPEQEERGDADWLEKVRQAVEAEYNVDPKRRVLGGFSQGASMADDWSCASPEPWAAIWSVSGTFWDPIPAECAGGLPWRHTHGRADQTWPAEGRGFGGVVHQGDILESAALHARMAGCAPEPVTEGDCTVWVDCAVPDVRVCWHEGGHRWPAGEIHDQLDWFENLPR